MLPFSFDPGQQHACRFVVGVLGNKLPLEGLLQNALPQGLRLLEGVGDGLFDLVANR